jgi:hypothetical protein
VHDQWCSLACCVWLDNLKVMVVQALSWLLTVPGASRTVLDARVPYAQQALAGVLGGSEPASYASPETARDMAMAAYRAAAQVATYGTPIIGLGCSCALATDRPKHGDHKASCRAAPAVLHAQRACPCTAASRLRRPAAALTVRPAPQDRWWWRRTAAAPRRALR